MGDVAMTRRVYIHLDAMGAYLGNGGFLALTALAGQLRDAGYTVAVFDARDRLQPGAFAWLDIERPPAIARLATVLADDAPILTSWLRGWLDTVEETPDCWSRLRYWCHDELLRTDSGAARAFVRLHLPGFAVTNLHLVQHYWQLDLAPSMELPLWVADRFYPDDDARVPGRIGYQPDRGLDGRLADLRDCYGHENVIACTGTQQEVADKMRTCDVFVWWNNPKNLTFDGEGFGLSLYEAMASGCAVVAREHAGNHHLFRHGIALVDDWAAALDHVGALRQDTGAAAQGRHRALGCIARDYRWNTRRAAAARRLVEGNYAHAL